MTGDIKVPEEALEKAALAQEAKIAELEHECRHGMDLIYELTQRAENAEGRVEVLNERIKHLHTNLAFARIPPPDGSLASDERITLVAKHRSDGSMFVTSPEVPFYSAVAPAGDWITAVRLLHKTLEVNALGEESENGRCLECGSAMSPGMHWPHCSRSHVAQDTVNRLRRLLRLCKSYTRGTVLRALIDVELARDPVAPQGACNGTGSTQQHTGGE